MKDAGLSYQDFADTGTTAIKKALKPLPPKFRITDSNGSTHEWSGRGRTPKVFKTHFANGGSKDGCHI